MELIKCLLIKGPCSGFSRWRGTAQLQFVHFKETTDLGLCTHQEEQTALRRCLPCANQKLWEKTNKKFSAFFKDLGRIPIKL